MILIIEIIRFLFAAKIRVKKKIFIPTLGDKRNYSVSFAKMFLNYLKVER